MNPTAFTTLVQRGQAEAVALNGQNVVVTTDPATLPPTTLTLTGIVSEVEVDPQQLEQFGYNVRRVFSLRVTDPAIVATVRPGMMGVAPTGESCRLLSYRRGRFSTILYFGSTNQ
ncbi:hypothetical protein BH20VER3_BH20VER3_00470 [soil metagenome]